MAVAEAWEKIERWIAQQAPEEDPLPGPCTRRDLDRLYDRIGGRLPKDVEESLLRHDGSGFTTVIPPGFTLLGVEDILRNHATWLHYAREDDRNLRAGDKAFLVPVTELSVTKGLVDIRTGQLGWWDIEQGYMPPDGPLDASLSAVLEFVGNVLASPPPWIAILPGDEEWEATDVDPDFPGTLQWTEELPGGGTVEWDMERLNREFGFGND
ncbi:hypothetical protein [Streptomyces sp. NPDC002855]|uniref:hypothetical protein n=1 Tax=unclassified Streptomyces TaxID=2593676 RepID=UPI003319EFEA